MSARLQSTLPEHPTIPRRSICMSGELLKKDISDSKRNSIQEAINYLAALGGGQVIVPAGIWFTGPIHLRSRIELHLEEGAELRFSQNPQDYLPVVLTQRAGVRIYGFSPFVYAFRCQDIAITGQGILNGQGHSWWPWKFRQPGMHTILKDIPKNRMPVSERIFGSRQSGVRPVFCQPFECQKVLIEGVTFINSPSWTIHPVGCHDVTISCVTVRNPPSPLSHNTDGIDPESCCRVLIDHCHISTGDDAICLKSGLGPDAWELGMPCEHVTISNCVIRNGHGAITIGSEMSGGVRSVSVYNCEIDGSNVGLRIKSKATRGGFISNIAYQRIQMERILSYAVDCNLLYDGNVEEQGLSSEEKHIPSVEAIHIQDVSCASASHAINLQGLPGYPLMDVRLSNVTITSNGNTRMEEVTNLQIQKLHIHSRPADPVFVEPSVLKTFASVAEEIHFSQIPKPTNCRPMGGRTAAPITYDGSPLILRWRQFSSRSGSQLFLRITIAMDHRCEHQVQVANACTEEIYGVIDVRQSCPGQVYELRLPASFTEASALEGLALFLQESAPPLWIVVPGENAPAPVLPHLTQAPDQDPLASFYKLFCSSASLQPCDWMGICVLDGLADLAAGGSVEARMALKHHLSVFFDPKTGKRENFYGHPNDSEPGGPETTGPFAILAMLSRNHPGLDFAVQGFHKHWNHEIRAVGSRVAAETSYNIAYPMMALAIWAGKDEWHAKALRQLRVNQEYLSSSDDLWLRFSPKTGEHTFPNWSRGVAWYLLGLIRSLALLPDHERPEDLLCEADRLVVWATRQQLESGLWPCFLKERSTPPDTSGSAGIAAAIAFGCARGILEHRHRLTAEKTYFGLQPFLTADGWLRGASQSNKRESRDLQRSGYRVIAPWGMGLFAQLSASLRPPSELF